MENEDRFELPNNRVAACSLKPNLGTRSLARPLRIEHRSQGFGGPNASSYTIAAYWWTVRDLNPKPSVYETDALTYCANGPYGASGW